MKTLLAVLPAAFICVAGGLPLSARECKSLITLASECTAKFVHAQGDVEYLRENIRK